ncbi:Hydroxyacylglutathione hydrolase [Polaromonas sp. CG9_12]|nr:Hydroxyacylglutathione hydrolase [Polaromonas sp. CG9_12]
MYLNPVSAFGDNYLWLLHDTKRALLVDPGDAAPVLRALQASRLQLESILVTHHHADHTGGIDTLRQATGATVCGPAAECMPAPFQPLREGNRVATLGLDFQVLKVPGHTAEHMPSAPRTGMASLCSFVATRFFQGAAAGCLKERRRKCWHRLTSSPIAGHNTSLLRTRVHTGQPSLCACR